MRKADYLQRIKDVLSDAIERQNIAGANVLVYHKGKELFYCDAGYADKENQVPIKRDTIFRLYSMTKPVIGAASMLLMQDGTIDLNESVSKYLPSYSGQKLSTPDGRISPKREPKLADLLAMASGLTSAADTKTDAGLQIGAVYAEASSRLMTDNPMTTREFADAIGRCDLAFEPGERWKYGPSADVMGAVIEAVTGMRLGDFLKEKLFDPLGMPDTAFFVPHEKQSRLAKTYRETPDGMIEEKGHSLAIQNRMETSPAFESGGAGLSSTIDDYMKFAQMLLNDGTANGQQILTPKALEYYSSPHLSEAQLPYFEERWEGSLDGFNYGNFVRILTHPGRSIFMGSPGEYGWDGALGVYFMNSPLDELSFLFMTQRSGSGTLPVTRRVRNLVFSALSSS